MLKHLGVSRSGYHAWLKRIPSNTEKRREAVKAKIQDIYDVIIPGLSESPVWTLRATILENESHIFR